MWVAHFPILIKCLRFVRWYRLIDICDDGDGRGWRRCCRRSARLYRNEVGYTYPVKLAEPGAVFFEALGVLIRGEL